MDLSFTKEELDFRDEVRTFFEENLTDELREAGQFATSIWIDPKRKAFVILLSNRNHPYERKSIRDLRWELGTLAAEAVGAD